MSNFALDMSVSCIILIISKQNYEQYHNYNEHFFDHHCTMPSPTKPAPKTDDAVFMMECLKHLTTPAKVAHIIHHYLTLRSADLSLRWMFLLLQLHWGIKTPEAS